MQAYPGLTCDRNHRYQWISGLSHARGAFYIPDRRHNDQFLLPGSNGDGARGSSYHYCAPSKSLPSTGAVCLPLVMLMPPTQAENKDKLFISTPVFRPCISPGQNLFHCCRVDVTAINTPVSEAIYRAARYRESQTELPGHSFPNQRSN